MNSSPFLILTTERLTLRQVSLDDQDDIFVLRSDPEINRFLDRQRCRTIEDAITFITRINENGKLGDSYYWAITLTDTKTLVGTICLFDFSVERNSCEIGYELKTEFQGHGLMNEAVQVVIDFAFQTLKVKKIGACTHDGNQKSTSLLLKFNFKKSLETDKLNPDLTVYTLTQ